MYQSFRQCKHVIIYFGLDASDAGRFGIVFEVEDRSDSLRTHYAMKFQKVGDEFNRELKVLGQFNSSRIVGLKRGELYTHTSTFIFLSVIIFSSR